MGSRNIDEYTHMTNPIVADSDNDGRTMARRVALGTDLLDSDSDNDGLSDGQEATARHRPAG